MSRTKNEIDEKSSHDSVMLREMISFLAPKDGGVYMDCTFGAGGYSKAILDTASCKVIALDRDPTVIPFAEKLAEEYGGRFQFHNIKFSDAPLVIKDRLDGIVLDLGVSSMQIDNAERGFSFQKDAPLDMRMGGGELTAADVVNTYPENELADIIFQFGDEVKSRQIAKKIIEYRKLKPVETTGELAEIVHGVYGVARGKIDTATKTFQALRIFINEEMLELKKILQASLEMLKPGGRLVVVSFHSLEDGIVKDFLKRESGSYGQEKINKYKASEKRCFNFKLLTKKPAIPSEEEVRRNVRARSAKLRSAERCS